MSLLSEVYPTGHALERPHPLVDPLVHVAVAGRGEYFSARLAGVLPLLQLLVALLVCFVVAPQREGLRTQRTGNGSLITNPFPVFVR